MCCETSVQRFQTRQEGCGCGCAGLSRRFLSLEEEKTRLEEYLDQLKKELLGVQERINRIQTA